MIKIIERSEDKLVIKDYPTNYWFAFFVLTILAIALNYYFFFLSPASSSLTCTKGIFNTTNCQLLERSFFHKELTHKTITNVQKPRKVSGYRVGKIWLKTEISVWGGGIKNIYYPNSNIFGPYLYRTDREVSQDLDRLNNFIHSQDKQLRLNRKMPSVFYIVAWLFPFTILPPILAIFIYPIITYTFYTQQNILTIKELVFFSPKEEKYSLEKLKISSTIENRNIKQRSLSIKIDSEKTYKIDDFTNETEALNLLKLLSQFVAIETIK